MPTKFETFIKSQSKNELPDIRPGDTVRVYQKIPASAEALSSGKQAKADKSAAKKTGERIQAFEGLVLARKHGQEMGATIIVRKEISGVGVEKTFPLHSPIVDKIEIVKRGRARRAKLYYLRTAKGKRARIKEKIKK